MHPMLEQPPDQTSSALLPWPLASPQTLLTTCEVEFPAGITVVPSDETWWSSKCQSSIVALSGVNFAVGGEKLPVYRARLEILKSRKLPVCIWELSQMPAAE